MSSHPSFGKVLKDIAVLTSEPRGNWTSQFLARSLHVARLDFARVTRHRGQRPAPRECLLQSELPLATRSPHLDFDRSRSAHVSPPNVASSSLAYVSSTNAAASRFAYVSPSGDVAPCSADALPSYVAVPRSAHVAPTNSTVRCRAPYASTPIARLIAKIHNVLRRAD